MNEKKEKLITTAIELFAEKGFHTTSIQEIAEKSHVSKGAFYLHFHSKDELLLEIFKYYYELINAKIQAVTDAKLSPRENLVRQIEVQIEEVIKHSSFIITQLREQAITLNNDLIDFLRYKEMEMHHWYEDVLELIYGPEIKPHVMDVIIMYEGIKNNYLQALLKQHAKVDIHKLSNYVVRRLDDLVRNLLSKEEKPMITTDMMKESYKDLTPPQEQIRKDVTAELNEIQAILDELHVTSERAEELQAVIDFLLSEIKKTDPQKIVIQGMLANLKGIAEFDKHRKRISQKLGIRLL